MRRHAEYGYEFLRNVEFLKDAAEIVYHIMKSTMGRAIHAVSAPNRFRSAHGSS